MQNTSWYRIYNVLFDKIMLLIAIKFIFHSHSVLDSVKWKLTTTISSKSAEFAKHKNQKSLRRKSFPAAVQITGWYSFNYTISSTHLSWHRLGSSDRTIFQGFSFRTPQEHDSLHELRSKKDCRQEIEICSYIHDEWLTRKAKNCDSVRHEEFVIFSKWLLHFLIHLLY